MHAPAKIINWQRRETLAR